MAVDSGHFRNLLEPASQARYVGWRLLGSKGPIDLRLRSGLSLHLRSGTATDYGVAWDIFWRGCYRSPEPISDVRRIVDLGANVGFSCLFWCQQYPEASVTAFEPHPRHLPAIAGHVSANGFSNRVDVVAAAAGVEQGTAFLTDAGSSSTLTAEHADFTVPIVDIFPYLEGPIDILKIDIEGGEYAMLEDERFRQLNARTIVIEWHKTPEISDGRAVCEERLRECGYRTVIGTEDQPLAGLLWAFASN